MWFDVCWLLCVVFVCCLLFDVCCVVCCLFVVVGCVLLVVCCPSVVSLFLLFSVLHVCIADCGCSLLVVGYWLLDVACRVLRVVCGFVCCLLIVDC